MDVLTLLMCIINRSILSIRSLIHLHVDILLQHVESGQLFSSSRQQKAVDLLPAVRQVNRELPALLQGGSRLFQVLLFYLLVNGYLII